MNRNLVRKFAALTACLAVCAGTSCGKVDRPNGSENVTVSGTDSSDTTVVDTTADGDTQANTDDPEISTVPTGTAENTSQANTSAGYEANPVPGEPTDITSSPQNPGGTGTSQNPGGTGTSQNPGGTGTSQNPSGTGTSQNPGGTGTSQNPGGTGSSSSKVTGISLSFSDVKLNVGSTKMPIVTMSPASATNKDEIWTSSDESVATVDYLGNITGVGKGNCIVTVKSADNPSVSASVNVTVEKPQEPAVADGATYISGMLIANKTYALPPSYNPGGLTSECYSAFQNLVSGAAADNINIYCSSGFRSYESQRQIYNNYVAMDGQAKADTYSARPGHSEHQTGLAIDCNIIDDSFTGTPEAIWLEKHCHEYGFIIRYPRNKEHITGYKYEPWHIRYIGVENATAVHNSGLCLEEYLGITSQYTY